MQSTGLEITRKIAVYEYDFDTHGGGVGSITVTGTPIPKGSIIKEGVIYVKTAVTSGGAATVGITGLTALDLLAATGKASFTLSALIATVPVGTAATSILVTSNITSLSFVVAVAALTAGKVCVQIEYLPPTE